MDWEALFMESQANEYIRQAAELCGESAFTPDYTDKKPNDDSIPHPVISTVTHGAPAECVQWRNLHRLFMNVEIPPLRMFRWRSACFGRNDDGRVRLCMGEEGNICMIYYRRKAGQALTAYVNNSTGRRKRKVAYQILPLYPLCLNCDWV